MKNIRKLTHYFLKTMFSFKIGLTHPFLWKMRKLTSYIALSYRLTLLMIIVSFIIFTLLRFIIFILYFVIIILTFKKSLLLHLSRLRTPHLQFYWPHSWVLWVSYRFGLTLASNNFFLKSNICPFPFPSYGGGTFISFQWGEYPMNLFCSPILA